MLFQSMISKKFKEENEVGENFTHLRVVRPQEELQKVEEHVEQQVAPVVLTDEELTYNWLKNAFKIQEARLKSECCLFGTFSLTVPVEECKPEQVKAFMLSHNIPVRNESKSYNLRTKELKEVRFTFDTPTDGILFLF